jgi:hypothetical protein
VADELVGYKVAAEAPVLRGEDWPCGARLGLVLRDGCILLPDEAGSLAIGDYAYLVVPAGGREALDGLFSTPGHPRRAVPATSLTSRLRRLARWRARSAQRGKTDAISCKELVHARDTLS